MGKKRITQLLEQLQVNQQQELQNAAAIFAVAQVAVNQLGQAGSRSTHTSLPELSGNHQPQPQLPAAPMPVEQAELRRRYGSHQACRQAAKRQGIIFRKNPSWEQLEVAFGYLDACQQLLRSYLQTHPAPQLRGVSLQIDLDSLSREQESLV
ncbi:MAG: hypothetical protein MUF72_08650 [Elainella sp. Prado103]|nr:hypothetical protein [Elainella sp. Prado103]